MITEDNLKLLLSYYNDYEIDIITKYVNNKDIIRFLILNTTKCSDSNRILEDCSKHFLCAECLDEILSKVVGRI
jgi:hypothetical protein